MSFLEEEIHREYKMAATTTDEDDDDNALVVPHSHNQHRHSPSVDCLHSVTVSRSLHPIHKAQASRAG